MVAAGCSPPPEPEQAEPDPPDTAPQDEPKPEPEPESEPEPEPDPPPDPEPDGVGAYGVSAGHPEAVDTGMAVMADGGNAVDAAIATAFAVSVVEPFASGIGGGGAALVVEPANDAVAFDYREMVPLSGQIPASQTGVPGFVAGMAALHEIYGSMSFADVLAPAIELAAEGAATSQTVADLLRSAAHRLPVGQLPHLYPGGSPLATGAPLVQEDLAATLTTIADGGAAAFYEGDLAATVAGAIEGIDEPSLAAYEVDQAPAVSGTFADYRVVTTPPPLPGAALIQMLQVSEALDIGSAAPGSADFIHAIASAWRLAERFVNSDLGDPAFVEVPVDEVTDAGRNAELAEELSPTSLAAASTASPGDGGGDLAGNTTHLSVVDADGMVVSMTNTITNFWGSGQYVAGFFVNDQLSRFSIGDGPANQPAAGRRSVSWSLPTVVLDDEDRPVLVLGSPGGRRIPNVLAQVLIRWALHGETLEEAVSAPRFHLEGNQLEFEQLPSSDVADNLRSRGHAALSGAPTPWYFGSVQALEIDHDARVLSGATDTRREADWRTDRPVASA